MGAYEDNLEHLARPSDPSDRSNANSIVLNDHEALWLAGYLREFAHYGATEEQSEIAVGAASYIDTVVRDEAETYARVYLHTETAVTTIVDALAWVQNYYGGEQRYPKQVHRSILDQVSACIENHPEVDETEGAE